MDTYIAIYLIINALATGFMVGVSVEGEKRDINRTDALPVVVLLFTALFWIVWYAFRRAAK